MKLEVKTQDLDEAGLLEEFAALFGMKAADLFTAPNGEIRVRKSALADEPLLTPRELVDTIHDLAKALDIETNRRVEERKLRLALEQRHEALAETVDELTRDVAFVERENHKIAMDAIREMRENHPLAGAVTDMAAKLAVVAKAVDTLTDLEIASDKAIVKLNDNLHEARRNESTITQAIEKLGGRLRDDVNARMALRKRIDSLGSDRREDLKVYAQGQIAVRGRLDELEKGAIIADNARGKQALHVGERFDALNASTALNRELEGRCLVLSERVDTLEGEDKEIKRKVERFDKWLGSRDPRTPFPTYGAFSDKFLEVDARFDALEKAVPPREGTAAELAEIEDQERPSPSRPTVITNDTSA